MTKFVTNPAGFFFTAGFFSIQEVFIFFVEDEGFLVLSTSDVQ